MWFSAGCQQTKPPRGDKENRGVFNGAGLDECFSRRFATDAVLQTPGVGNLADAADLASPQMTHTSPMLYLAQRSEKADVLNKPE